MKQSNFDELLRSASQKLNTSPESLKKTLEKGDIKALSQNLSRSDKEKLRAVLQNKELMQKLKKASDPNDFMKILGEK